MRNIAILFAILSISIPCAATTVTFTDAGGGVINWTSDGAGIVAMALDVDMTSGQIDTVTVDSFFDIFMDQAYDEEAGDGYEYGEDKGNGPIADQDAPGQLALPLTNFCISMGGLGGEAEPLNDPCTSGTITLTGSGTGTISENELRGGVIDENGDRVTTNLPLPIPCHPCGCYEGQPDYDEWIAAGMPECWCYPTQCQGDADGKTEGGGVLGIWHVGTIDVGVLAGAWLVKEPTKGPGITSVVVGGIPGVCADFDHTAEGGGILGSWRVGTIDVGILAGNWLVKEPTKGPGIAKTCLPGNVTPP